MPEPPGITLPNYTVYAEKPRGGTRTVHGMSSKEWAFVFVKVPRKDFSSEDIEREFTSSLRGNLLFSCLSRLALYSAIA
jgi:hypothetical protein